MKRILCMLFALALLVSLGGQAFADSEVLYCRICGRQIPTDSRVCPYCGVKVVHVGDASAAASAQTAVQPTVQAATQQTPGPFNSGAGFLGSSGRVTVTKSPTSESVPYGGSCCFIAHAANAASVTWYIATPDAGTILTAYEAADAVASLSVSGGNTDTLTLSGIPSWMNGYQVQACFTGEGGPVYTDVAKIWTYEQKVRSSTCDVLWKNLHPEDYYVPWPECWDYSETPQPPCPWNPVPPFWSGWAEPCPWWTWTPAA